jgi:hypothetical protein
MHPLKAWRKRQMVNDPAKGCKRSVVLTDVPTLWGVAQSTWHSWEQSPDHPDFRRPDEKNMAMLFEISGGEITPELFYPIDEWRERLAAPEAADRGG